MLIQYLPCVICGEETTERFVGNNSPRFDGTPFCSKHVRELADWREAEQAPLTHYIAFECQRWALGPSSEWQAQYPPT